MRSKIRSSGAVSGIVAVIALAGCTSTPPRRDRPAGTPTRTFRADPPTCTAGSAPANTSTQSRIAWVDTDKDDDDLGVRIATPDGRDARRLWPTRPGIGSFELGGPAFSPDGTRVAIGATIDKVAGVYTIDVPSGRVRRLATGDPSDDQPAFSPDGRCLAFVRKGSIYVVPLDASRAAARLTAGPHHDGPAWSPDGTRIMYSSTRPGRGAMGLDKTRLESVSADGSGRAEAITEFRESVQDVFASYSPDGRSVIFSRSSSSGGPTVYLMPAHGGRPKRVAHRPVYETEDMPVFSPDGTRIIMRWFAADDPIDEDSDGQFDLVSMSATGRDWRRITWTDGLDEEFPAWSGPVAGR